MGKSTYAMGGRSKCKLRRMGRGSNFSTLVRTYSVNDPKENFTKKNSK